MKSLRRVLIFLAVAGGAFIAGRFQPFAEPVPPPLLAFDAAKVGFDGRRADIEWKDKPIDEVASEISRVYGVKVVIDRAYLERKGWRHPWTVRCSARNATVEELLLRCMVGTREFGTVSAVVRGNAVILTDTNEAAMNVETRMYDLRPLYARLHKRPFPSSAPANSLGFFSPI